MIGDPRHLAEDANLQSCRIPDPLRLYVPASQSSRDLCGPLVPDEPSEEQVDHTAAARVCAATAERAGGLVHVLVALVIACCRGARGATS